MENYPSNSNKSKGNNSQKENPEQEKKIEKVIAGGAKKSKKTGLQKMAADFVHEDLPSVKSYVLGDILIPALKRMLSESINAVTDSLLYPDGNNPNRRDRKYPGSYVSYRSYYDKDRRDYRDRDQNYRSRSGYQFDPVILSNRGDAEMVLAQMDEIMDTYGAVSVSDLYDLVGLIPNYTDNKYGWTDIRDAGIIRLSSNEYEIKMPRATALN